MERKEEINAAINLISSICRKYSIGLIAKPVKGECRVVVQDARDGKLYVLAKRKG